MENQNHFTDPRDGQTYKTVEIDNQIWLAENLRYKGEEHFAPNGDETNTARYGCLYTWDNAMRACPEGWHLPTKEEFLNLLFYNATLFFLKPPAGFVEDNNYYGFSVASSFWSSSEHGDDNAYNLNLGYGIARMDDNNKKYGFSVRCIKN